MSRDASREPSAADVQTYANEAKKARNPHDLFFTEAFRHHEVAQAEMIRILPPDLLGLLDLGQLALDETRLLDARFKALFSDRLFRIPLTIGGAAFVWILIEHRVSRFRSISCNGTYAWPSDHAIRRGLGHTVYERAHDGTPTARVRLSEMAGIPIAPPQCDDDSAAHSHRHSA